MRLTRGTAAGRAGRKAALIHAVLETLEQRQLRSEAAERSWDDPLPPISAVAAMAFVLKPDATTAQVLQAIANNTDPLGPTPTDYRNLPTPYVTSGGRVNAVKALDALKPA